MNVKPIIGLKDGELQLLDKVRGKKKAILELIENIPEDVHNISICHILNLSEAKKLQDILAKKFPDIDIAIDELGPVVGSHLGPKTLGICFY